MSYTRTQIRQELLVRWPFLGFAATADSFATTYVADVSQFQYTGFGTDELRDLFLYRYSLADNDRVKQTTTVDTSNGRLSQGSSVYSDTTTLTYELLGLHPDEINNAIITAERHLRFQTHTVLGVGHDFDMQTDGTDYWDGSLGSSAASNASVSKNTNPLNVYSGMQCLQVTTFAANGYTRSELVRVSPGQQLFTAATLRVNVGGARLKLYDVTNAAFIETANDVEYEGRQMAVLSRVDQVPEGCHEVQVQITGTTSLDDIYVDSVYGPMTQGRRRLVLPEWMDEHYTVQALKPAAYASQIGVNTFDAYSREFVGDWKPPLDFSLEPFLREANPAHLIFTRDLPHQVVWVEATRSWYEVEPLVDETSTFSGDIDELMAYVQLEVAQLMREAQPEDPRWQKYYDEARLLTAREELARPLAPREPIRLDQVMRI